VCSFLLPPEKGEELFNIPSLKGKRKAVLDTPPKGGGGFFHYHNQENVLPAGRESSGKDGNRSRGGET